jgi:hypothetical protein
LIEELKRQGKKEREIASILDIKLRRVKYVLHDANKRRDDVSYIEQLERRRNKYKDNRSRVVKFWHHPYKPRGTIR